MTRLLYCIPNPSITYNVRSRGAHPLLPLPGTVVSSALLKTGRLEDISASTMVGISAARNTTRSPSPLYTYSLNVGHSLLLQAYLQIFHNSRSDWTGLWYASDRPVPQYVPHHGAGDSVRHALLV